MKAVLLVGGKGTRLRPLTYRIPKPLVPVMGKPLMMHVIDSLPKEVDETIVPVGYMRDVMEDYLRKNPPSRKITIVEEKTPMGTGGAVKNVEEFIDGPFLVINGDSISSLDIQQLVDFHRRKRAFATISLWEVEDPTPFGVVDIDPEGRIRRFQEKPRLEEAFSRLINAGVYALDREVLDYIHEGFVSMEREVFPEILKRGMYGVHFDGYWVDCGTRENLLTAYRTMMDRGQATSKGPTGGDVRVTEPTVVEASAEVAGASLGPYTYISSGACVGIGSVVKGSVVLEGARIGKDCRIVDSIIDAGVVVSDGSQVVSSIESASEEET
jgi:mannose-1-phosphate guanylyltransferase